MSLDPTDRLAVLFFVYLAIVGVSTRRLQAGAIALVAAGVAWLAGAYRMSAETVASSTSFAAESGWAAANDVWMLLLLFGGYRVAGLFFERPNVRLERWLLDIDHRLARAIGSPRRLRIAAACSPWLELAYLCVYPLIPLGALIVRASGPASAPERFWWLVLASGFVCYGALPWLQTRSPRVLEPCARAERVRALNLMVLARGSVGVNTVPSGHAATAVATALGVAMYAPAVGALFGLLAAAIAIATVTGRYHFAVDTILGVTVALFVAWCQ